PLKFSGGYEDAAEEFKRRLFQSVELQLRSDVPVGSCLSGGLDSSAIVCIANSLLKGRNEPFVQKTFTACSAEERYNERKWAELVKNFTGSEAHYVYPSLAKLFEESEEITWHQDEPFGSSSIYAQWNVFKLAAGTNTKVILDGQGADEQLAGYHSYFGPRFVSLLLQRKVSSLWNEIRSTKALHGYSELKALMYISNILFPDFIRQQFRAIAGKAHAKPSWFNFGHMGVKPMDPFRGLSFYANSIQQASVSQLTSSNLQMLLHWEDRNSMAHSIEARVPFLDHNLVEFTIGLPDEYKLSAGVTKRVLRTGMSEIIPSEIENRVDKIGFATPEEMWLKTNPEVFRQEMKIAVGLSKGIINGKSLSAFEKIASGKAPFS
ncbi:MAG: asparagine synthase C-terminal domain-containing protein, partial [Imperialibacter sp.]